MANHWTGRKHKPETLAKMRGKTGDKNPFFGRKHSPETIEKLRAAKKGVSAGRNNPMFGKVRPDDVRRKISATRVERGSARGERNPNWRGGISKDRSAEMQTTAYKSWRSAVFERDRFTCQDCGVVGGDLQADHVKPWAFFPDLRYELSNGRTLCVECHKKTFKLLKEWKRRSEVREWTGFDLDGCLAVYDRYRGPDYIGSPVPKMVARVKEMLARGERVKIFTARANRDSYDDFTYYCVQEAIKTWCLKNLGKVLEITCSKDFHMKKFYDDRAVQVVPNTGERVDGVED